MSIRLTDKPTLQRPLVFFGLLMKIIPGDYRLKVEVQRAPDNGAGSPDVGQAVTIARVGPYARGGGLFADVRAKDGARWHYRVRHVDDAKDPGAYTAWLNGIPYQLNQEELTAAASGSDMYPISRAIAMSDGDYAVSSSTNDGLTAKDTVKESGGKQVRRLLGKPLPADPDTLDSVGDGATYQRPLATALTSGQVDLSKAGVIEKYLNRINRSSGDATPASTILQRVTNAGHAASDMQESGGKEVRRLYAKPLPGDPDTADSLTDGSVKRAIALTTIDGSERLLSEVYKTATIAGRPALGVSRRAGILFSEEWSKLPSADGAWAATGGATLSLVTTNGVAQVGQSVLQAAGFSQLLFQEALPYNPSKLYRLRARFRVTANDTGSHAKNIVYIGVQAVRSDGSDANSNSGANYVVVQGDEYEVADGWIEITTWLKGANVAYGSSSDPSTNPALPSPLNTDTVAIRPYALLNYDGEGAHAANHNADGTIQWDYYQIEELDEQVSSRDAGVAFGTTVKWPVNRHVEQNSGIDSTAINFAVDYENVPEATIIPKIWKLPGTSSTVARKMECRETDLDFAGCTLLAQMSTGSSSSAESEDPSPDLNGTTAATQTLTSDGSDAFWNLAGATNVSTTYNCAFKITTAGSSMALRKVLIYKNDNVSSTSWTLAAQRSYDQGLTDLEDSISFEATMGTNWDFKIVFDNPGGSGAIGDELVVRACTYNAITAGTAEDITDGDSELICLTREKD